MPFLFFQYLKLFSVEHAFWPEAEAEALAIESLLLKVNSKNIIAFYSSFMVCSVETTVNFRIPHSTGT